MPQVRRIALRCSGKTGKQRPCPSVSPSFPPALAVPAKSPPKGDQWVHEAKWNGYRIQIVKDGQDVRLYSKGGREWTKRLPAIAEAFAGLSARSAIMDGELCFCDERGGPNFRALHHAMRKAKPAPERLVVFTFDLMHLNSADLRAKPLHERRRRMVDLVQDKASRACLWATNSPMALRCWAIANASASKVSSQNDEMLPMSAGSARHGSSRSARNGGQKTKSDGNRSRE